MRVYFEVEYELTKEKIYNDENEVVREYVFVVDAAWLKDLYESHLIKIFGYDGFTLDDFLDMYDPDVEGVTMYHIARGQRQIKEEGWAEVVED